MPLRTTGYGSQRLTWSPGFIPGIKSISKVEGTLSEQDIETLKRNGFINLGPMLTIHYQKESLTSEEV